MTNEELVKAYQHSDSKKEILNLIYEQNQKLIAYVCKRYFGLNDFDDILQEGFIGLCTACDNWDDSKGACFSTYAVKCIRLHLIRFLKANKTPITVPEAQLSLMFKYNKLIADHSLTSTHQLIDRQICLYLGISNYQLEQLRKDIKTLECNSLDAPILSEDEELTLMDSLADDTMFEEDIERDIQNEELKNTLWGIVDTELGINEATALHEKYENEATTKQIAERLDMDEKEAQYCINKAMTRLRKRDIRKRLTPFLTDEKAYSIGLHSSLNNYMHSWTSSTERAVMLAEEVEAEWNQFTSSLALNSNT